MKQMVAEKIPSPEVWATVPAPGQCQTGASLYVSSILYSVPLVCFTGAVFADISYVKNPDIQWSNFSSWLLAFGIIFLILAIVVSIIRFSFSFGRKTKQSGWPYALFILAATVSGLFDNFVHGHDGWTSVWPMGLMLSAMAAFFLFIGLLLKVTSLSNTYVVEAR
jgi:uncharacterized membrane protein